MLARGGPLADALGEVPSSGRHRGGDRAAGHAIASEGLQAPRTFADTFASLGEARLLEQALASRLQDAVAMATDVKE